MFMMIKTVLETARRNVTSRQVEQQPQLPPEELLVRSVRALRKHRALSPEKIDKHLSRARMALDALPLATADYAQAAACLENAHGYFQVGVHEAARYELRTLWSKLRSNSDDPSLYG